MDVALQSLPSVESANLEQYWNVVRQLEPEFFMIRIALQETELNSLIIPKVIRALSNLSIGTGYGRVTIFMSNHKVTQIKTEESDEVNQQTTVDTNKVK